MGELEDYIKKEVEKGLQQATDDFVSDFETHWIIGKSGGGCRPECAFCKEELDERLVRKLFVNVPRGRGKEWTFTRIKKEL